MIHEAIILDNDWFILQEFKKIFAANHDQVNSENLLDFNRGDLIFSKIFRFGIVTLLILDIKITKLM